MADFSFLNDRSDQNLPVADAGSFGGMIEEAGGAGEFLKNPNTLQALLKLGSGISQGQSAGEAIGTSASDFLRNRQLQSAAAKTSGQRSDFMSQLLASLNNDPTGKALLGPKDDKNTLDAITLTNDGINIKAPNPSATKAFEDITDQSLESQAGEPAPIKSPVLGDSGGQFPFL